MAASRIRARSPAIAGASSSVRHARKLRTGTHRDNRFRLRLRECTGAPDALEARLRAVAGGGFPNYFGPQRFGRAGENLKRARAALAAGRRLPGIQLSAARSWLFNLVLDARVRDGSWDRALVDDALMLAGSHSLFRCRGDEPDLEARLAAHDIDPTGPMWGLDPPVIGPVALERERAWLAGEADLCAALERTGVRHSRRPLRAVARELGWSRDGDVLQLDFVLPRGAFATSLLVARDPRRRRRDGALRPVSVDSRAAAAVESRRPGEGSAT